MVSTHYRPQIEPNEPHKKPGMNRGAAEIRITDLKYVQVRSRSKDCKAK